MAITTRGGKQTIDPPMSSNEEKVIKDNDKVVEGSGEAEDCTGKDAEVPINVIPMARPPHLSSMISEKDRGWYISAFCNNERSGYKEKIGHVRG